MSANGRLFTRSEIIDAAEMLGLSKTLDFSADDINRAWKKIIEKVHPDAGGSNYFAKQANHARETLLKWIDGDRGFVEESQSYQQFDQTDEKIEEIPPSGFFRFISSVWYVSKFTIKVALGLLLLVGFVKTLYNGAFNKKDNVENPSQSPQVLGNTSSSDGPQEGWTFIEAKVDGGEIVHEADKLFSNGKFRLSIGCYTKSVNPADNVSMFVLSTLPEQKIKSVDFRRYDDNKTLSANIYNKNAAILITVKSLEAMNKDDFVSVFGLFGSILAVKWYLMSNNTEEIGQDVKNTVSEYYNRIFGSDLLYMHVKYQDASGDQEIVDNINFNNIASIRDKMMSKCMLISPYR